MGLSETGFVEGRNLAIEFRPGCIVSDGGLKQRSIWFRSMSLFCLLGI